MVSNLSVNLELNTGLSVFFNQLFLLAMQCSRSYFSPDFRAFIFASFLLLVLCFIFAIISEAEMTIFAENFFRMISRK